MFPSIDLQAGPGENETDVDEADDTSSPSSCQGRHTVVASAPDTEDYNDCSSNDENTDDSESCTNDGSEGNEVERSRPQMSLKWKEIWSGC